MWKYLARFSIAVCVVALISQFGTARGEEALPSQDQALARALESHPDIIAAKAKVSLAEAELYGKRMEVSRQVLELFGNLKRLELTADVSKAELNRAKAEFDRSKDLAATGVMTQSEKAKAMADVQTAEAELVHAFSQREQTEKALRLLIGRESGAAEAKASGSAAAVARQMPQGAIVERMKAALEKPIQLDFAENPLVEVVNLLGDEAGIKFSVQTPALAEAGLRPDEPISISTAQVPLQAALQAFEDEYPQLQFVLRDYGVLVTARDYSEAHGYAPVLELGKEPHIAPKSR